MTVICDRTGESFASASIMAMIHPEGCQLTLNSNPISPSFGQPSNSQQGSQFWMQSDYTGSEPSLDVKALYSDAQYAYNQIPALIAALGITSGQPNINPSVQTILTNQAATTAPATSTGLDLSGLAKSGQGIIDFLAQNALVLTIGIGVILLLPTVTSALSTRGR